MERGRVDESHDNDEEFPDRINNPQDYLNMS